MSQAAKSGAHAPDRTGDKEQRFLKRTMQFHASDAAKKVVFEKLQSLKIALDRQETTLSDGPVSPGKHRIREALAKAKTELDATLARLGGPATQPPKDDDANRG